MSGNEREVPPTVRAAALDGWTRLHRTARGQWLGTAPDGALQLVPDYPVRVLVAIGLGWRDVHEAWTGAAPQYYEWRGTDVSGCVRPIPAFDDWEVLQRPLEWHRVPAHLCHPEDVAEWLLGDSLEDAVLRSMN